MAIEFYDDKQRANITVAEDKVSKTIYERDGQTQYALITQTADGRTLNRFISKREWDQINVRQVMVGMGQKDA
jgi:hypothetical protein